MRTLTLRPTTSASSYPKSRSAPGLNASIRPRSSMTTMPSTADSTTERQRAASDAAAESLSAMRNFGQGPVYNGRYDGAHRIQRRWHVFRRDLGRETYMKVEQLMTPSPATCGLTENLAQVVERMWDANCGIIPVVDDAGHVLAVITDRDICVAAATRGLAPGDMRADDMQRKPVVTCRPEDALKEAMALMQQHRVRRLP